MATEYIHVKIGLTDGIFPVLELCTTGTFSGFYHYRCSPTKTAWTHRQWCTPCTSDGKPLTSGDTDWRKFLREHWNAEHNHCKVEYLDEFYAIFRRAAAAYINKQHHEQEKNKSHHQHGAHEPRRADTLPNPSGGQRAAASLPAGDKTEVRETGKQMKPVQLSLFPDF